KSFTLIELSIVLLILSLLVGSLLVGRQIVDRAKIQRIIFEFDYYEKAFHQFYDTYRTTPGAMIQSECIKYSQFQGEINYVSGSPTAEEKAKGMTYHVGKTIMDHSSYCACFFNTKRYVPKNIQDNLTFKGKYITMQNMVFSGLIEDRMRAKDEICVGDRIEKNTDGSYNTQSMSHLENTAQAAFNSGVNVMYAGFHKYGSYANNDREYGYTQRLAGMFGINTRINTNHELNNISYMKAVDKHNAIVFFAVTPDQLKALNTGVSSVSNASGAVSGAVGAINAKQASELDAKIDDGRPGSGTLLALKSGHARRTGATDDEIKQACYDQDFANVDKAIYHTTTNLKYGCNIIKVMEDVK
ncbi:MAG: hypothetical protein IJT14_00635, partial [Rickettsiales bacterium]|nr:hypothetical protein [Rickettsiales bacterium]